MFRKYLQKGKCRWCPAIAQTPRSTICKECDRLLHNARMLKLYQLNISKGLTARGKPRKRPIKPAKEKEKVKFRKTLRPIRNNTRSN